MLGNVRFKKLLADTKQIQLKVILKLECFVQTQKHEFFSKLTKKSMKNYF